MKTKALEFKTKDFYLPIIGLATMLKRNPVETAGYSPKTYLQVALFSMFHVAYTSSISFLVFKGLEKFLD